jgi:hypothetical protein
VGYLPAATISFSFSLALSVALSLAGTLAGSLGLSLVLAVSVPVPGLLLFLLRATAGLILRLLLRSIPICLVRYILCKRSAAEHQAKSE